MQHRVVDKNRDVPPANVFRCRNRHRRRPSGNLSQCGGWPAAHFEKIRDVFSDAVLVELEILAGQTRHGFAVASGHDHVDVRDPYLEDLAEIRLVLREERYGGEEERNRDVADFHGLEPYYGGTRPCELSPLCRGLLSLRSGRSAPPPELVLTSSPRRPDTPTREKCRWMTIASGSTSPREIIPCSTRRFRSSAARLEPKFSSSTTGARRTFSG